MTGDVLISRTTARARYEAPVVAAAMASDLIAVLAFALIGRLTHDGEVSAGGVLGIAWPFVLAVAGGWLGVFLVGWAPLSYPAAAMVLGKTLILGLVLRAVTQEERTPLSFVVVTALVLGGLMFGWRAAVRVTRGRGLPRPSAARR